MTSKTEPKRKFRVVGTRPIRHDGWDKVLGRAAYGADVKLPGLVHGAVLRSPHAHARIVKIDTAKAEKAPGVLAVMTAADMPVAASQVLDLGEEVTNATYASDRVMARAKAVYNGHPVAAVAAVDLNTALEALTLIDVVYEVLTPVVTIEQAMAPGAPLVHDDLVGSDIGERVEHTNVAEHIRYEVGDPEAGFAEASTIVELECRLSRAHQGYIEPQTATAFWSQDGKLTVWTSTQASFGQRDALAGVLMRPVSSIKVVPMEIGGGFGGKIGIYLEPLAAVLSRKCGRPVKLVMERRAVFDATGPAPGGIVRVKMGVDDKGLITAATADIRYGAGAYPGAQINPASVCVFASYRIANARVDGYDIVINLSKTSAYRAPGAPQATFATETVVDEICRRIGMDPAEFRLLNASKEGDRRVDGPAFPRIGNVEVVEAIKGSAHYRSKLGPASSPAKKRGRGMASGFWQGIGGKSTVTISVNNDGVVSLIEGSVDIGGTRASIAMQAAEVLGIAAEDVHPSVVDTDSIGHTDLTAGSRTTYATGAAAIKAAEQVVEEMKNRAALAWETDAGNVRFEDGVFSNAVAKGQRLTFKELSGKLGATGGQISTTGVVNLRGSGGGSFAAHLVDVEVDTETGKVEILRYTAAQDAGKAVHPAYVEGQMEGGAVQGIGWALNEEYVVGDDGVMQNATFLDYRMPTTLDVPTIETIIVEVPNERHPFGVRGIGETGIVPPMPAISNALRDALGVRLTELPMKPGRIMAALKAQAAS